MSTSNQFLYIPIEIGARELDAKLLIAIKALNKNFTVILGRKAPLINFLKNSQPGVFLSIWGAHKNFKNLYKSIKDYGHNIAAMDEEGLITLSDSNYLRLKMDKETLSYIDVFFTWGEEQENKLKLHRKELSNKFIKAGNPRMELLHPKFKNLHLNECADIKRYANEFVLIVSSFGFCNHFDGHENYFSQLKSSGVIRDDIEEEVFRSYFAFQDKNFKQFLSLTKNLAEKFSNINFVYRKHPAEDLLSLKRYFHGYKNILLDHSKSITPWIKSSKAVIHNYCTTAVEAQLLGLPTLAYRYFIDEDIESDLPYINSEQFISENKLINYIDKILNEDDFKRKPIHDSLDKFIYGLNNNESSSETIVNSISDIIPKNFNNIKVNKSSIPIDIVTKMRNFLKIILKKESYVQHKFGVINSSHIKKKINDLCDVININSEEYYVDELSKEIFVIKSKTK